MERAISMDLQINTNRSLFPGGGGVCLHGLLDTWEREERFGQLPGVWECEMFSFFYGGGGYDATQTFLCTLVHVGINPFFEVGVPIVY